MSAHVSTSVVNPSEISNFESCNAAGEGEGEIWMKN